MSGYVSDNDYVDFINALVTRGANLHVLMFLRQGSNSRTGLAQTQYGLDLTKNTGGLYQTINAPTGFAAALTTFARRISDHYDEVSTRYRLVYDLPDDVGPGGITVRLNGAEPRAAPVCRSSSRALVNAPAEGAHDEDEWRIDTRRPAGRADARASLGAGPDRNRRRRCGTPDGQPDISGTFTFRTLTSLSSAPSSSRDRRH